MSDTEENWRQPPPVEAPCFEDRSHTRLFGISDDLTGRNKDNWRRTPLYQVWTHLHGRLPPFNLSNVAERDGIDISFSTLRDATACFQGIERPHAVEDNGESVLTYVLQPTGTVRYHVRMTSPIKAIPVPPNVVLTVQVRLRDPLLSVDTGLDGVVTRIEPVRCDPNHQHLPVGFGERYRKQCW